MSHQNQIWQEVRSGRELLIRHVEALQGLVSALDLAAVERAAESLDEAYHGGNTIYCAGNGGSAATASHLATDLSWGRRTENQSRPRAISLVANVPLITAVSNDMGYASVFLEQLTGAFRAGDVLVAISASGNSENVLRAVQFANEHGGSSVGLVGFDGGQLKGLCHVCVHVPTPIGAYELVEDVHHAVCHMLANYLKYTAARRAAETTKATRDG